MQGIGKGKKQVAYQQEPCMQWLLMMSKAALADCVVDLLRANGNSIDEAVTEAAAIERLSPVLAMRGDRIPATESTRVDKSIAKARAARIFDRATQIAKIDRRS